MLLDTTNRKNHIIPFITFESHQGGTYFEIELTIIQFTINVTYRLVRLLKSEIRALHIGF